MSLKIYSFFFVFHNYFCYNLRNFFKYFPIVFLMFPCRKILDEEDPRSHLLSCGLGNGKNNIIFYHIRMFPRLIWSAENRVFAIFAQAFFAKLAVI